MTSLHRIAAPLVLFASSFSGQAFGDTYHHIDELALHIARQSRELLSETRHYRSTPEYRHLVYDAKDLYRLANHLHLLALRHGSLHHMEADLRELDRRLHHVEDLVVRIERAADHGYGYVHGRTKHVRCLLRSIADDIHHLQDDLRTLRCASRPASRPVYTPPVYSPPIYGRPPHPSRPFSSTVHSSHYFGRSLSIGGGSSRLTIRF